MRRDNHHHHHPPHADPTTTTAMNQWPVLPTGKATPPLHTATPLRRTPLNRCFFLIYTLALFALFHHHVRSLSSLTLPLLIADLILAFQWLAAQLCFRSKPIRRREYPKKLTSSIIAHSLQSSLPAIDIFICTADPYKEPPMGVVNTALSVMAYEYFDQSGKLSVYVSDDGGSQMTLFAFMEAARFAKHWIPFCRENKLDVRAPEVYFQREEEEAAGGRRCKEIQGMYRCMEARVESVMKKGRVEEEDLVDHDHGLRQSLMTKWTNDFTRQNHPAVVQVLLDDKSRDTTDSPLPTLIYLSRGKSRTHPHHFKAGALNALLRVSSTLTNAPIILTLDCDMYSNNPHTLPRILCYFMDPSLRPELAYVQCPQIFQGMNHSDIYACEHKRLFQINPLGFDGWRGPNYVGSNCFFQRRALFGGGPGEEESCRFMIHPENSPDRLALAHRVAEADYEEEEEETGEWGTRIGFRYGSLVEDFYTGYRLHCEGWRSVFCHHHPDNDDDDDDHARRPAFMGDVPVTLVDLLGQCKRWSIGLLEALLCKHSVLAYGATTVGGLPMSMGYTHYSFWPIMSIPITVYAFLPQLALLNGISLFPPMGWTWALYVFLFSAAYAQDLLDYLLAKGTFHQWWNCQRMWMICGLSSFLFGTMEYALKHLGISCTFTITSKVAQEDEVGKRYRAGKYEFGVESPMFVPIVMAAVVNLVGFAAGMVRVCTGGCGFVGLEMVLCGFAVLNCCPVYEAMVLRKDKGRMPGKVSLVACVLVAGMICLGTLAAGILFKSPTTTLDNNVGEL